MNQSDIVIVGGGLAGAAAAESYRKAGGTGSVTILSADVDAPVHRPPLSKEYLRGDEAREKLFVHPSGFYDEQNIDLRLETRVDQLDLEHKRVVLAGGDTIEFGTLVLATGARPRRLSLPGAELQGVHYLRSARSADQLRAAYAGAERAVIIGAGFIGMEVAATLTQRGVACTVVEMAPAMWSRIVPPAVSSHIQGRFEQEGVEFRFGAALERFEGDGHVRTVVLSSGERLPADLVVVGVGVSLNTELAEAAGLPVDRGVVVDEYLRTAHPDVYAIGDIAAFPDSIGGRMHAEHWDNALRQGQTVGKTLAGDRTTYSRVAYFFSDMFDLSVNLIGYPADWDSTVLRGDPESGRFTCIYGKDGEVRAALMINDDEYFDAWDRLVARRAPLHAAVLQDLSSNPSSLLEPAAC